MKSAPIPRFEIDRSRVPSADRDLAAAASPRRGAGRSRVAREWRVFPVNPIAGKIGRRQAAAMALEEFQRWSRHGQVLRPGEVPPAKRSEVVAPEEARRFSEEVGGSRRDRREVAQARDT